MIAAAQSVRWLESEGRCSNSRIQFTGQGLITQLGTNSITMGAERTKRNHGQSSQHFDINAYYYPIFK